MIDTFSSKADKLLSQAAESGDSEAMYWLGKMFAHRWSDEINWTPILMKLTGHPS